MVEFWRAGGSVSLATAEAARAVEAEGWDGQMFMDSQSLGADPYALMGAWAIATERIKLSPGVTNPLTRHPVVTAAAIASVQSISGGRAVLGIGRGDSALAHIGLAPVSLASFRQSLSDLQQLLRGEVTSFASHPLGSDAPGVETLSLSDRPTGSHLKWLPPGMPKVPLDVAATGPKVIAMAAAIAERVTFSVGAIPERLEWAIEQARAARRAARLQVPDISYGAQIIVVCHPDKATMLREVAPSMVAPLARFQVIQGEAAGPRQGSDSANFDAVRRSYDMNEHGRVLSHTKLKNEAFSPEFVDRFAIVGPPDECIARLLSLAALGLERFVVVGPGFHPEAEPARQSLFAREVIPAVRAELARTR
ncbi:MAG TPA: LLM class flavin-dependent oxidoreductase [Steroidobacteraceae bacterium]|jgi:5,10-methylenetetrahydromethanopterin reductase|nr:LLM class flavin-dependent oxidoreductase [Steroidobacteraceae bacterium]